MKNLLQRHPLITLHVALVLWLCIGLVQRSGTGHLHLLLGYAAATVVLYLVFFRLLPVRLSAQRKALVSGVSLQRFVLVALPLFACFQWYRLGGPPLYNAVMAADELTTSALRDAVGREPWKWINYVGMAFISAFIPFTLAQAYATRGRYFTPLLIVGAIYAVSLLPKSYIVVIVLPLVIMMLCRREFLRAAAVLAGCLACILALAWLADPDKLRQGVQSDPTATPQVVDPSIARHGVLGDALLHVGRRIILTPGWTVADWFEHIPADIPYCRGGAVRPLALVLGKPYVAIPDRIYDMEFPEETARGIHGTVPSAAFMYDYANFGPLGLLLGAFLASLTMAFVARVFGGNDWWGLCLGAYPMMALASAALTTVLLTHGWAAIVLLFVLVRPAWPANVKTTA